MQESGGVHMYVPPLKCFSDCAVQWGKRTEKHSALAQVQPDQNKSRASPCLLGKYCGNKAREKSERAPGVVTQQIDRGLKSRWDMGFKPCPDGVCIFFPWFLSTKFQTCKKRTSYFRGVLSSLDHRTRLPHLTPFFCSLNLVVPSTEWSTSHWDAENRSCAIVIQKELYCVHQAHNIEEM